MAEDLDPQSSEPTLLEYARFHGIAIDHTAFDEHFEDFSGPYPLPYLDLEDPPGAQALALGPAPTEERIQCSREVGRLLTSIMQTTKRTPWESILPKYRKPPNLKFELPLLKSDHDQDKRGFGLKEEPIDTMYNLLLLGIDEKKDEGFSWPSWYEEYPEICMNGVVGEKLSLSKDAWLYLQNVRSSKLKDEDAKTVFDQCAECDKKRAVQPLTPLLPVFDPDPIPYVPSSSTCHLELLSELASPLTKEHTKAEDVLKKEKLEGPDGSRQPLSQDDKLRDSLTFEGSPLELLVDLPKTPRKRSKSGDLKVEIPLTPLVSTPRVTGERTDHSHEVLQDTCIPETPLPREEVVDINDCMYKVGKKAHEGLRENLKQERPTFETVKLRVSVPQIGLTFPNPPWMIGYDESRRNYLNAGAIPAPILADIRQFANKAYSWPFDRVEERRLHWRFFPPEQGRVNLREIFEDSGYLIRLMSDIRVNDGDSFNTICGKGRPFRSFNASGNEADEILAVEQPELLLSNPLQTLPRSPFTKINTTLPPTTTVERSFNRPRIVLNATTDPPVGHKRPLPSNPTPQSFFSWNLDTDKFLASKSVSHFDPLSEFMRSRGKSPKRPKITATESSFFRKQLDETPVEPILPSLEVQESTAQSALHHQSLPLPMHPITLIVPLALDKTHPNHMSSLLTQSLSVEVIVRDYACSKVYPRFNQVLMANAMTAEWEPDIALSPSTGIILTTVPQISQTSLPGHRPSASAIRTRISHLSIRYERIYMLIATKSVPPSLDASACAALTSLCAFCTSLAAISTISPIVVPSLTTSVLQRYILNLAAKHCLNLPITGLGITMLAEETTWELFLRWAGLNAYAAQVLVNIVKRPDEDEREDVEVESQNKSNYWGSSSGRDLDSEGERRLWGLQAILQMTPREREERFMDVMGGTRVLERVSKKLDAVWG